MKSNSNKNLKPVNEPNFPCCELKTMNITKHSRTDENNKQLKT